MKYLMREITIMRQLSKIDDSVFSPTLFDIIIPEKHQNNIKDSKYLFIVMEYFSHDFSNFLRDVNPAVKVNN